MRDASKTPEPVPKKTPKTGDDDLFVIQEHHARRLHYDLRLERNGVLVSWAVPKNLPDTPAVNHLAVHTEDHPLEYLAFHGSIPKGEYGAGEMIVWDTGTYETEKFNDVPPDGAAKGGEVIVTLHGNKIDGRYALIQTDGKNWLAHRMKEQQRPQAGDLAPMLATEGSVQNLKASQWAFEGKWDGYRVIVDANHGRLNLRSRRGRDVTHEYPQFEALAADLAEHHVILDGEAVALDASGVPSFGEMQNRARSTRVEYWAFDILHLDGRSLLRAKYSDRRRLLEALAEGGGLIVPDALPGDGPEAMEHAREHRWEGVIAKKRDSTYQPGRRSHSWIKDKIWNTQEVVIGGWRQGEGGRSSGIGALMLGIPEDGGLHFAGRVGTGFTEKELTKLKGILKPLHTDESPFNTRLPTQDAKGVTFVRPELVGEVRYSERTTDGRLRQPSWRGLRPDKAPSEVSSGAVASRRCRTWVFRTSSTATKRKQRFTVFARYLWSEASAIDRRAWASWRSGIVSELAAAGFDDAVEVGGAAPGSSIAAPRSPSARSVAIKVLASDLDEDDRERFCGRATRWVRFPATRTS